MLLVKNAAEMVERVASGPRNSCLANRVKSEVFPTPESPTTTTLKAWTIDIKKKSLSEPE